MDAPVAIAASANFEARSSVAYDAAGRLWIGYEASDEKWGKDFGVYDTKGVSLYRGQTVHVRCLQAGRLYEPKGSLDAALKYAPGLTGREGGPNMKVNNPGMANVTVQGPRNSIPRLAVDSGGRVYLTFRSGAGLRSRIGSIYQQFVTVYNGSEWTPAVEVPLTVRPGGPAPGDTGYVAWRVAGGCGHGPSRPASGPIGEETTGSGAERLDRALLAVKMSLVGGDDDAGVNRDPRGGYSQTCA